MQVKAICREIVDELVERTNQLSQGRNAGCIGFINELGVIDTRTDMVDGGISGLPLRQLLSKIVDITNLSVIEGIAAIPENACLVTTRPGKSGLITDVSGVSFFNIPIVSIGVKEGAPAGVGIIMPEDGYFDLATKSEQVDLDTLAAQSMEEEKEILRAGMELSLQYLEVCRSLDVVEEESFKFERREKPQLSLPRLAVDAIEAQLAQQLVERSTEVGQGREVAMLGKIEDGRVKPYGKIVAGGMGYVPSRLIASSAVDVTGKSLREIYAEMVPEDAVFVHTHPGGTGVMHIGDANAGPGTWGRPIIAIGHDKDGQIKGATVIEVSDKLFQLADEDEDIGQAFFDADTPEAEADIRNRKFGIAQEYTSLCKPIEIN